MNLYKTVAKCNEVCLLCQKYNIRWRMNLAGITIYHYTNDIEGKWFPLVKHSECMAYVLDLINHNTSQSTLDQW